MIRLQIIAFYLVDEDTNEFFLVDVNPSNGRSYIHKEVDFLIDNQVVTLESYEGEPIDISLPNTIDVEVTWAEAAIAGDTANVPSKQVEIETGYRLQAPMFIQEGDTIRIDTRDGKYVTRVKK